MPRKAKQHRPAVRPTDKPRGKTAERGYGGTWRKLRRAILSRDPLCRVCQREPSAHVDHIIPKAHGGLDTEANLQGLCARCHSIKTVRENGGKFGGGEGVGVGVNFGA